MKSFTGVQWGINRWTAPTKGLPESATEDSGDASADSSTKENQENSQAKSDAQSNSNSAADVEMSGAQNMAASSPAPIAIAAAS